MHTWLCCFVTLGLTPAAITQAAPRVVSLAPGNLEANIDPRTTKLTIEFDQAMGRGHSLIGGGPGFPRVTNVRWKNNRTLEIFVRLRADHDYALGLNNERSRNFRSAAGVSLAPVHWSFTTLPARLPDPKLQRPRNQKAFEKLQEILTAKYSYADLRVRNWESTFEAAKPSILAAKTDVAWAREVAHMLEPTADIHLYLRAGARIFATGRRAVDPLYRRRLLRRYFRPRSAGNSHALYARTQDGIGYLMISSWTERVDLDAVDQALGELRACKAIIIDARPNAGGNERLAQRIAAWFVAGKQTYAKNRYRLGSGKDGFGPALDRVLEGNQNPEKQYRGPIAVLTSRYVMSSNESFVMMLQQANDCTVVGQPTYGSSGNPKAHELGNGVTIMVPSWQDLRLDRSCIEGEGIKPDVLVEATAKDLLSRDPILEKALELLREKIAK